MNPLEEYLHIQDLRYGGYAPQSIIQLRLLITRLFYESLDLEVDSPQWQANLMELAQARIKYILAKKHPDFRKSPPEKNTTGDLFVEINELGR